MSALIWQFEYLKCMLNKEETILKLTNRERMITMAGSIPLFQNRYQKF